MTPRERLTKADKEFMAFVDRYTTLFSPDRPRDAVVQQAIDSMELRGIAGCDASLEAWPAWMLMEQCIQFGYEVGKDPEAWLKYEREMKAAYKEFIDAQKALWIHEKGEIK